jgi:hypothetical protein
MISHTTTPRHQQGYGAVAPGKMLAAHNGTSEYNVDETADAIISNSNDPIWPGTRTYVPLFVMAGALVLAFYHIAASSSSFVGSIDIDNAQKGVHCVLLQGFRFLVKTSPSTITRGFQ